MTKEERENAIRCLKLWIEREPQLQTYKTCLEALEQEPQCTEHPCLGTLCRYYKEPCTDAVSREAVLQAVSEGCFELRGVYGRCEELINALPSVNPQPCDDAISREAVFNAIEHEDKWLLDAKGHNGLTEIAFSGLKARVDALPSVTQKSGKWIDVNERLPEGLLVKVLVSCEDSLGLPIVPKVVIYDGYEHSWECDEKVIAWMPLPKPYEPQESER